MDFKIIRLFSETILNAAVEDATRSAAKLSETTQVLANRNAYSCKLNHWMDIRNFNMHPVIQFTGIGVSVN